MLREPSAGTASTPRTSVAISFGSPAGESGVTRRDLNDSLIRHPQAAFMMRIAGGSMREAGIEAVLGRGGLAAAPADEPQPQGLVVLFSGAAGSGRTLVAHTLPATLARDLVRVDLRHVMSKYIGETQKNLDALLARVEHSGAVLLLDEADALFGKRTEVQDAHDRYAGSETDHVLQRLQDHNGMVILVSTAILSDAGAAGRLMTGLRRVVHFPR